MRIITAVFCLCLTVACAPPASSGGGGGSSRADAGPANVDPECLRSSDCEDGYRCVDNACEEIANPGCASDRDPHRRALRQQRSMR